MKTDHIFIVLTLIVVNCYALPTEKEENAVASKTKDVVERMKDSKPIDDYKHNETLRVEDDPELIGGYFEGDMIIGRTYNGIAKTSKRWPNGVVHYKITSKKFGKGHESLILKAMKMIESRSCIRFLPASDTTKAFVKIIGDNLGCYSDVGYTGREQIVNLQPGYLGRDCFQIGKILHELLHALGFLHQHNVPERDNYVEIISENIINGKQINFRKNSDNVVTSFGVNYDYHSIMHYGDKAFSRNGRKTIILLKGNNIQIGQRYYLSDGDAEKLNLMYNC